jgi:two pore calcium channel protein
MNTANRFDLFVTVILLAVSVVWATPHIYVPQEALRYFTILRLLRLLELVKQTKRFSFISTCLANIAKGSTPVMLSVFAATAIFAILGSHIYGGLVYGTNPDLQESEYFKSNLDVLNFNDFSMR